MTLAPIRCVLVYANLLVGIHADWSALESTLVINKHTVNILLHIVVGW
jgi:hypothetical protein